MGGIILSIAVLIVINKQPSEVSAGFILGYLGLLFLIFLFRKDLPIREGIGDSCRRLLVQVMPASVFLITASFLLELKNTIKREGEQRC